MPALLDNTTHLSQAMATLSNEDTGEHNGTLKQISSVLTELTST
jgi:hypothetical protein